MLAGPEHPCGKHSIEECLHQGGSEEVLALLVFELDPERLFERAANCRQGWKLSVADSAQGFARVRGQKPGHVFWSAQRRRVQHHTLEKLDKGLALLARKLFW